MRHHFADFLDRGSGYWTITPNFQRYGHSISNFPESKEDITVATVGKDDKRWERILTLPKLEELTLHEPTTAQLDSIARLTALKRLRITHARPRTLEFLRAMGSVEELVLEYVSGFSDVSPIRDLPRLRALHVENLRRVTNFGGLAGSASLRYLAIYGTLDWKQPISDFEFLRSLPSLEVLGLFQVIIESPFPALLPALQLKNLKRIRVSFSSFVTEEYALLEEALPGVEGATWGPFRIEPGSATDRPGTQWVLFTGKGAGRIKSGSLKAEERCREFASQYAAMKLSARKLISEQGKR